MAPPSPRLNLLARAEPDVLAGWLRQGDWKRVAPLLVACITCGCALYGFSIGIWRAPLQGLYVAVKMPLLIFLTLLVNGLINGMLAALLGSGLSFRQTLMACLISFGIFGLIVGSLSPIAIAMALDAPRPGQPGSEAWYRMMLLSHTGMIAFAGVVANHKLLRLLQDFAGSAAAGKRVLVAWLAGNLFVGAQLSYNLRPFFGNPRLPVEFVRPDPFDGTFYEAVARLLAASLPKGEMGAPLLLTLSLTGLLVLFLLQIRRERRRTSAPAKP
jgi:hypothetical protein